MNSSIANENGLNQADVLLMVESMRKELETTLKFNANLLSEKERQSKEIDKLEEEIKETIEIYTKMIIQMKEAQFEDTMVRNPS